jgi:hypothetical protein
MSLLYSEDFTAQMLIAAGRGPARVTTCRNALEHVRARKHDSPRVLARAMSLLRPGELPALRVVDVEAFDVVLSVVQDAECDANDATLVLPRVLDSLQAVGWSVWGYGSDGALTIVKHCAGTLKDFDCRLATINDEWNEALANCTRLEFLTTASRFAPAAWLGLSQLHTLLDVDLAIVSVAAIAAALPRLHTLGGTSYYRSRDTTAAVAGFFDTLLPRLRVFRFNGDWPVQDGLPKAPVQALPLLEELVWQRGNDGLDIDDGFAGAQPVTLCAPYATVVKYAAASSAGGCSPLSRVRDLQFYDTTPQASEVAAVLRAAPELRTLDGGVLDTSLNWCSDPAFAGLVHRKLRLLQFQHSEREELIAAQYDELQAHHCPRLRSFVPG